MKLRRYQLNKAALALVPRHPWIFREQMSSAAEALPDGAMLRLFDGTNQIVAYGIYEATGAIAVRVVRRGAAPPDAAWIRERVAAAIAKRAPLADRTTAMRLVHGESDELPAVVIDRFGDTLVVQSYALGADAIARYAAICAKRELGTAIARVVSRPARRRRASAETTLETTTIVGTSPVGPVAIVEDGVPFAVDLAGQKSGAYLDLRGLRRALAALPLTGAHVLNTFAYSGMLGRIAERAGAARIVQVDQSETALAFARDHHADDRAKHDFVVADVFEWLPALAADHMFDVAIIDPPSMTSSMKQIPTALAAYRKLYTAIAPHVKPNGIVVAACCTSRIERKVFREVVKTALGPTFEQIGHDLPVEVDHPVAFPQADYLKISLWRRLAT